MAAATWMMRSEVTMIVIPVRISGNWCLYKIMRGSQTQVVLRLTEAPLMIGNQGAMVALTEVDQIFHSMASGAMRLWTRMLLRDTPNQGFDIEQVRRKAQVEQIRMITRSWNKLTLTLTKRQQEKPACTSCK